ncbi:phosphotransferase [Streptomyces lydicus]|uniref:phosphotransferase n=1 Tax=Streptomyces lydicus TaxID=47763 RepID=UPI0036EFD880
MSRLQDNPDGYPCHAPKVQVDHARTHVDRSASRPVYAETGDTTGICASERQMSIPGCVLDWASFVLGAITGVLDASRGRANSKVWELTCADGTRFFLKIASAKASYDREVHAYRFAVPALGPGRAPRLQAANPGELAMLLTAVPGETVAPAVLDMNDLIRVHRQAGYLLRELHDTLLAPHASVDVLAEVRARTASAGQGVAAAGALLSHDEQNMVLRLIRELPQLEACPTAFVHGDAREFNFLWDGPSGCAVLLDFGQARPAVAVDDFVRLAVGPWMQSPRLRRMFFSGYGRELTGPERRVLPALAAIDAVDNLVRGVRVRDPEVTEHARATLKLLANGVRW